MTTALNIPIDAAAARLRAASYTVERQGMHWRVAPPGGELAITSADEVRALAIGLGETTTTTALDYAALDAETRIVVQQRTTEIKALMKRAASDIIEIGQKLIEVKAKLPHGAWLPWLRSEFAWSDDTARNHMNVARAFREIPNGSEFDARALYLLAASSTPQAARVEAIERASAGETITLPAARQMVTEHKPPALPPVVPALPAPPSLPADIADAARALGLTAEARGDGVLLYWPDEADDLGQMDPLWPDTAREWLANEAPGLAARRAEMLSTPPATARDRAPTAADFGAARDRAAAIGLILAYVADRGYSLKNARGSGVSDYGWADILAHLAHQETAHAENEADRARRQATTTIRRGDRVQLPDGAITAVIGTPGGYIVTSAGTYAPWQLSPPPPADPRATAVAWLGTMRTMLAQCPDSTSFRKSEMQTALKHVEALLALLSGRHSDSPLSPIADRVAGVERGIAGGGHHSTLQNELRACRKHLDRLADDAGVDTAQWDALSHRIGEAQAQLIELEQAV